jgi:hypothetical protein
MKNEKKQPGRPPFDRELKSISVAVFMDQIPVTAGEIRAAIDFWRESHPRTFSETFSKIPGKKEIED